MLKAIKRQKAQTTLEYAIIIAVVVAALLAMQTYMKRGIQGKLKSASDEIGEQFSPSNSTYKFTTNTSITSNDRTLPGSYTAGTATTGPSASRGGTSTSNTTQEVQRYGTEHVDVSGNEYWK